MKYTGWAFQVSLCFGKRGAFWHVMLAMAVVLLVWPLAGGMLKNAANPSLCSGLRVSNAVNPSLRVSEGNEDFLVIRTGEIGRLGGRLVISQRSEPKTLNPLTAIDGNSRKIISLMTADLIHINRYSQQTEPAIAKSWTVSADGKHYVLQLRRGMRFSDGQPFDADDVLFSFEAYLNEKIGSPQRDLLIISGKPISVRKLDAYTVVFELPQPYAAAERLFDSFAMLPRHLLKAAYDEGKLATAWSLNTAPEQIAGLGPFRLKRFVPGQQIVLERNPYYWKKDESGNQLPYFDEIVSMFVPDADVEAMRFEAGETDIISGLNPANYSILESSEQSRGFRLYDLGPGLEYDFLFFNLNNLPQDKFPSIKREQDWFQRLAFREAISKAIDRESIVRLAYHGRACPISVQVTPGNKLWINHDIPQPSRSLEAARQILRRSGFKWTSEGRLLDPTGSAVAFSIVHNAANPQQSETATIVQQDLAQLGMEVKLIGLEFRTFLDRIFKSFKYEAVVMAIASGDSDPNSEMNVWTSDGSTHVWSLAPQNGQASWQQEIDSLMRRQLITLDYPQRKRLYDRVQELVWQNLPVICLVSPDILVGAKQRIGNFHPAILNDYTLWNVEQLFARRLDGVPPHS